MLRTLYFILFSLLLLTSCTSFKIAPSAPPTFKRSWHERLQLLSQVDQFQLAGKVAVRTLHTAGSATLNWKQMQGQYIVTLFGPLGSQELTIIGQKNEVMLQTAAGKKIKANSPEQLIAQQLGYPFPVSYLKYWVRGIPVQHLPASVQLDHYQRLRQLQQMGWHVTFASYTNVGNIDLPNRIIISSQQLQVKLIIYSWQYE